MPQTGSTTWNRRDTCLYGDTSCRDQYSMWLSFAMQRMYASIYSNYATKVGPVFHCIVSHILLFLSTFYLTFERKGKKHPGRARDAWGYIKKGLPTWKSACPKAYLLCHKRVSGVTFRVLWLYFATQRISVQCTLWKWAPCPRRASGRFSWWATSPSPPSPRSIPLKPVCLRRECEIVWLRL